MAADLEFILQRQRAIVEYGQNVPYWDELTPEEQSAKFDSWLTSRYGPDEVLVACDMCRDFKHIHPLTSRGKPDYSKIERCPSCLVWSDEERAATLARAGVPRVRQGELFETFRLLRGTEKALAACKALAAGDGVPLLLLYGEHGNGKTHLARAAMMEWSAKHPTSPVAFVCLRPWFTSLKALMDSDRSTDAEIERVKAVEFLVVDELGTEDPKSTWQAGVIEELVNARYDQMLPTIMTLNGNPREVLSPAIWSRLTDKRVCLIVDNQGADQRPRKEG